MKLKKLLFAISLFFAIINTTIAQPPPPPPAPCSTPPCPITVIVDITKNIQDAINAAAPYDTIRVPQVESIVTGKIVCSKPVVLIGAGIGKTILKRDESVSDSILTSWGPMFSFDINSEIKNNLTISGITFKSKRPLKIAGDGGSLAADAGIMINRCVGFEIVNCRFENFGNGAIIVSHDDSILQGWIHNNEFYHNMKGLDGLGLGYGVVVYGANKKWVVDPRLGSSNTIFIENNIFDRHRHTVAAGGCGIYCFRNNKVYNNYLLSTPYDHAEDGHDGRGGKIGNANYYSTRAAEIYGNDLINNTFYDGTPIVDGKSASMLTEACIGWKGGDLLCFNNKISGFRFGLGMGALSYFPWGKVYPIPYSAGYLSGLKFGSSHTGIDAGKGDGDIFDWDNAFSTYNTQCSSFYNYDPASFKSERDYHLYIKPGYVPYGVFKK